MCELHHEHDSETFFPEFPYCFVCGQQNPNGLRIRFTETENGARASFVPDETLVGYQNTVHGGIISTLLDEVIIWASYAVTKTFGVTAELNVRFLKPLPVHTECFITGKMIDDKKRVWRVEGKISDKKGNLFARATGKVVPLRE